MKLHEIMHWLIDGFARGAGETRIVDPIWVGSSGSMPLASGGYVSGRAEFVQAVVQHVPSGKRYRIRITEEP